jgi:hypothetical protein
MSGVIHPLPQYAFMAWCLVKHRDSFTFKREKLAGGCRILHNEELHNLYTPPNISREIKSSRMRWAGHVARTREAINAYFGWKT